MESVKRHDKLLASLFFSRLLASAQEEEYLKLLRGVNRHEQEKSEEQICISFSLVQ
jgi:hypothetical protein